MKCILYHLSWNYYETSNRIHPRELMSTDKIFKNDLVLGLVFFRCILIEESYSLATVYIDMFVNSQLSNFYSNVCQSMGRCSQLLCYFYDRGDSPKQRVCSIGQNLKALVWRWREIWTFKINISTLNAPMSTNMLFIFKLTIEDYFKN